MRIRSLAIPARPIPTPVLPIPARPILVLPILFLLLHLSLPPWVGSQVGPGEAAETGLSGFGGPATAAPHHDPFERINDDIFKFNSDFDRFVLEPVARAYAAALPLSARTGIRNAVNNLDVARKTANNLLQGRPVSASREVVRFVVNSTVGIAGVFDMAARLGLEPSDPDMGITLGVYGFGHGAYLVLPFLPPTTLRDGLGKVADSFMNPLRYFTPSHVPLAIGVTSAINSRSLNMEMFEALRHSIDPYGAARDAYLQIRRQKLQAARAAGP